MRINPDTNGIVYTIYIYAHNYDKYMEKTICKIETIKVADGNNVGSKAIHTHTNTRTAATLPTTSNNDNSGNTSGQSNATIKTRRRLNKQSKSTHERGKCNC